MAGKVFLNLTICVSKTNKGESNMELTDKIKEKIENAKSEEEVKTILENVKGGWRMPA